MSVENMMSTPAIKKGKPRMTTLYYVLALAILLVTATLSFMVGKWTTEARLRRMQEKQNVAAVHQPTASAIEGSTTEPPSSTAVPETTAKDKSATADPATTDSTASPKPTDPTTSPGTTDPTLCTEVTQVPCPATTPEYTPTKSDIKRTLADPSTTPDPLYSAIAEGTPFGGPKSERYSPSTIYFSSPETYDPIGDEPRATTDFSQIYSTTPELPEDPLSPTTSSFSPKMDDPESVGLGMSTLISQLYSTIVEESTPSAESDTPFHSKSAHLTLKTNDPVGNTMPTESSRLYSTTTEESEALGDDPNSSTPFATSNLVTSEDPVVSTTSTIPDGFSLSFHPTAFQTPTTDPTVDDDPSSSTHDPLSVSTMQTPRLTPLLTVTDTQIPPVNTQEPATNDTHGVVTTIFLFLKPASSEETDSTPGEDTSEKNPTDVDGTGRPTTFSPLTVSTLEDSIESEQEMTTETPAGLFRSTENSMRRMLNFMNEFIRRTEGMLAGF